MKQGDTITISGEFEGITGIASSYKVAAMVYCQNAKTGFKKLLYISSGYPNPAGATVNGSIRLTNPNIYSFVIPAATSANLQGECQVELGLYDPSNLSTAISDNYATFVVQNSVLGTTTNG